MKTFKDSFNETQLAKEMQDRLTVLLFLNESDLILESVNEAQLSESLNSWLSKVGLKLHKQDGLVDYVKQFSTGAGKMILAAIKGDKEKVKDIAGSLSKEKVIDFLLKLDMATLHIVTGPIHTIDAITGWDLWSNVEAVAKKSKTYLSKFYDAIETVRQSIIRVLDGDNRIKMVRTVNSIEKNMPNLKGR